MDLGTFVSILNKKITAKLEADIAKAGDGAMNGHAGMTTFEIMCYMHEVLESNDVKSELRKHNAVVEIHTLELNRFDIMIDVLYKVSKLDRSLREAFPAIFRIQRKEVNGYLCNTGISLVVGENVKFTLWPEPPQYVNVVPLLLMSLSGVFNLAGGRCFDKKETPKNASTLCRVEI